MKNNFVEKTMNTIYAIDEYRKRKGNDDAIEEYYKKNGSYRGIETYLLNLLETESSNSNS